MLWFGYGQSQGMSIKQIQLYYTIIQLFPPVSAVEGMESVPPVRLCIYNWCVCQRSHGWTVWDTNLKFCMNIALENILGEFEGQRHRSKVKVPILKNLISDFLMEWPAQIHFVMTYDAMWRHGMMPWCPLTTLGHDKEGTSREGASSLSRFHYFTHCWK